MKSKDKQIRELREDVSTWKVISIVTFIYFIVFLFLWVFDIQNHSEFESQLQSCQEKVPVWTLKLYCIGHGDFDSYYQEINFSSYNSYENALKNFEGGDKSINCEVLE